MDVGVEGEFADLSSDESDEDEDESEEVNMLKSKRRELPRLLRSGNTSSAPVSSARARPRCVPRTCTSKLTSLRVVPDYNAYSYPYAFNTAATTSASNNNNSSTSVYANPSAMKKPVLKHRSISEMLTGALQPSAQSGSPVAMANGRWSRRRRTNMASKSKR